jgi:plasmid stabilization system protein ParE
MAVEILPAAEECIVRIWEYTNREWGTAQADNYVRGLVKAIQDSGRRRNSGKSFPIKPCAVFSIFVIGTISFSFVNFRREASA